MIALMKLLLLPILCVSAATVRRDETVYDAARVARRLFSNSSVGTMATNYPPNHATLPGMPFSLQEYYASCYFNGTVEHVASISVWQSPHPSAEEARVSLIGRVTLIENDKVTRDYRECYVKAHPDAAQWLPDEPDSPHLSHWARFDPMSVYFVGGFGDEHYIGEIPLGLYQDSPPEEHVLLDRLHVQ